MIADVPATNLLGGDPRRTREAITDPVMFRRLLYAKNLVLWAFVAPLCSVVALIIGISNHDYLAMVITIIAITVMPFGVLGISAWVGIRFPPLPCLLEGIGSFSKSDRIIFLTKSFLRQIFSEYNSQK